MEAKEKTLKLIEYELINAKLVGSLNEIGLNADMYLTDISELIFESIGLREDEQVHQYYNELIINAVEIDSKSLRISIQKYSNQIYFELEKLINRV